MFAPLVQAQFLLTASTPSPSPSLLGASPTPGPAATTRLPDPFTLAGTIVDRATGTTPSSITCDKGQVTVCGLVFKLTGGKVLGQILQVVLGTPLQLLLIIVLAVLVRRFLIRLIERLSERIAQGGSASGRSGNSSSGSTATGAIGGGGTVVTAGGGTVGDGTPPSATPAPATPLVITRRQARARTLAQILRSITTVLIVVVAGLMILQELSLPVAPLLASASVVGVALGLGAQSLVRDVVAGMFMIIEDQYGVGDVVDVGAASGVVESVGLRVTRLRDVNGTVWYVRNGEIMRVGNQSQGWSRAVLDVNVGYGEDIDRVEQILLEIAHQLQTDPRFGLYLLDQPEVWGVEELTADSLVIRLVVKTYPQHKATVARELRRRIKQRFGTEGIEMHTMPHTVLVTEDEDEPTSSAAEAADALEH